MNIEGCRIERVPLPVKAASNILQICLCLICLLAAQEVRATGRTDGSTETAEVQLLPAFSNTLVSVLEESVHPWLKWPRFPDYQRPLQEVYRASGFALLWSRRHRPTPQARAAVESLAAAETKGLNPGDYDAELLSRWLARLDENEPVTPEDRALFDSALSLALMRYVSALDIGRINPRHVNFGISLPQKKRNFAAFVSELSAAQDVGSRIDDIEPKLWLYGKLKEVLSRYRILANDKSLSPPAFSTTLKPGDRDSTMPALRHMLKALGDLPNNAPPPLDPSLYDAQAVEAVRNFQWRHGLTVDGIIGKRTQAELRVPMRERVAQIERSLERLRWLPDSFGGRYLIANIPSFQLYGFKAANERHPPDLAMDIIVGQAVDQRNTPIFHATMRYIVFRPYWNVPYSIAVKEIVPAVLRNPGYLARNDMEIVDRFAAGARVFSPTLENIAQLRSGALKVRQRPGPKNALGLVKFIFPNRHNVYLHDTPARGLFNRARRDFSHGCIRVQNPLALAEFVLEGDNGWSRERIVEAMNGRRSRTVQLKKKVEVYIFYSTAFVEPDSEVHFHHDLYGHDTVLQKLLDMGYPYPP